MIITIASQKGGVGKTTLSILFSNFLSLEKNHNVTLLDFDKQNTADFYYQRELKETDEADLPYKVEKITNENIQYLTNPDALKKLNSLDDFFIIDTAGFLNESYVDVLKASEFIIIPFNYTEPVLHSTIKFAKYCRDIIKKEDIIFIPNNVQLPRKERRESVYEAWKGIDSIIGKTGTVTTKRIIRQAHMENLTISGNNTWHKKNANEAFEEAYKLILK
jgi:chromosome partitioning protein